MVQIQDLGASAKVNMLIHADIGWGKTTYIGSGAEAGMKILIIRPPIDHVDPILGCGAKEMLIRNHEDLFESLDYCRHEGHLWDWIWIDSYSLLQDVGLDDVYQTEVDRKGGWEALRQNKKARVNYGPDRQEYRINMWRLEEFVRHMVGMEAFNLGITCHSFWSELAVDDDTNEDAPSEQLMPWIQGKKMPQKICGMMNIVAYGEVRRRKIRNENRLVRILHTNKSDRWYAKNQFKLPDGTSVFGESGNIFNPTLPKMMEAIEKGRTTAPRRAPVRRRRRRTTTS